MCTACVSHYVSSASLVSTQESALLHSIALQVAAAVSSQLGCLYTNLAEAPPVICIPILNTEISIAALQVAAAVSSQLGCLYTNSRYLSAELTGYCQELTATLPEPLQVRSLLNCHEAAAAVGVSSMLVSNS
jgi:hypothetical protein